MLFNHLSTTRVFSAESESFDSFSAEPSIMTCYWLTCQALGLLNLLFIAEVSKTWALDYDTFLKACQAKELFFLSSPFCPLLLKTRDHFCAAKLTIVLLFYDSGQDIVPIIFWGLRFLCPIPGLCASEISPAHPRQKRCCFGAPSRHQSSIRHLLCRHRFSPLGRLLVRLLAPLMAWALIVLGACRR